MIQNKNIIYGLVGVLLLAGAAVFAWNSYQIKIDKKPDSSIMLPWKSSEKCGMENCHGLDITCGHDVPDGCDAMYASGDNCRQYASCQIIDGRCELKKTATFGSCQSCVEKCGRDYSGDQIKFFNCENQCAK